jgi:predicted HAD superfamily phosphohydrolase YqeG
MTLLAKNNDKLLVLMNNQNQRIKLLSSLLEIMSGRENVKPYYNRIQPLLQFFVEKDTIKKDDLNKIAPMIEKVRNGLIQE